MWIIFAAIHLTLQDAVRRLHGSLKLQSRLKLVRGLKTTSADNKHFRISFLKAANTLKSEICLTGTLSAREVLTRTTGLWGSTFCWQATRKFFFLRSKSYNSNINNHNKATSNSFRTFRGWKGDINNVLLALISKI